MTSGARALVLFAMVLCACGGAARSAGDMHDLTRSDGELRTSGEVGFQVRPLAGPGTKGPHEVAPASEPALDEVRAVLAAHADVRLRIECTVNRMTMGQIPDPAWGAQLAGVVARWLVDRGIDCRRLEAVGFLDDDPAAPAEKVRFFVLGRAPVRDAGATVDPCAR